MKVVGLTGGIGSGKSTVAGFFRMLGIPVYIADEAAKRIQETSPETRFATIDLLGEKAYNGSLPDRGYIASRVFENDQLLKFLNAIIHPKVHEDFRIWKNNQNGLYCIYEAAILFENQGHRSCDFTILITAPKELRINRLLDRDETTREKIEARMAAQWTDEKKLKLADFVIENINLENTKKQVDFLHKKLTFLITH
ncbi:MAG TPA: dephospho-CoA kinase [Flavobacteriaceae bacterium]|nr:dephospho-CoA kinase [Flavobacteriaceae bacterium]